MDELVAPLLRFWDWIDRVGGFPGKMVFLCVVIMAAIGGLTWYGNKR